VANTLEVIVQWYTTCVVCPCSFHTVKDVDNSDNHRVWFKVDLHVEPANPDYELTIATPTLSSTALELKVDNDDREPLDLEVCLIHLFNKTTTL